ncbi:MAG: adenine deaminase [Thermodesulfobacteriota bacterium]
MLKNVRLVDVLSGKIETTDIAVAGGLIAGIGDGYGGRESVDLEGHYVCPGLIDAHVHVESALVRPREFARAVVSRGVTTAVTNPHEIANVLGIEGVRFMLADAEEAVMDLLATVPSSVPASPLATSGAAVSLSEMRSLLSDPHVVGLGEVMDYYGVVAGDAKLLEQIEAFRGYPIDGHCPGLGGKALNAYIAAGISSDHECTNAAEAGEKIRRGMRVFIREGSVARNLRALLPVVTPDNERRLCFCTDDCQARDLLAKGSIDHLVRLAIAGGVPPMTAIRMATLNAAEHFRLHDRGAVAPGRRADLIVFRDLASPVAEMVYRSGVLVARDGETVSPVDTVAPGIPPEVRDTVSVDWLRVDFRIPAEGRRVRVIGIVAGELITESLDMEARTADGHAVADPGRDLLKIAVIERHRSSGRMGLGFVKGIGLKEGAIAGTVAHDHHNLIVIGADDRSMETAAKAVAYARGGQAVAIGERVTALLPLPIAGLMSDEPVGRVSDRMNSLLAAAGELGSPLADPFMAMSFLGLEVIPHLKLTDLGLVDVNEKKIVPLFLSGRGAGP